MMQGMWGHGVALIRHADLQTRRCGYGLLVLATLLGWACELPAQRRPGNLAPSIPVFLPAPRELTRELDRAAEDLEAEEYVDALTRLDFILNGSESDPREASEDYFLPSSQGRPRQSLQHKAEQMIGSLPEAGRQAYELAYGADAAKRLERAVASGDFQEIGEVARRYAHSNAGEEASLLLGRKKLMDGEPREALLHFRRLVESEHAASRFGDELALLHATALKLSHQEEAAREVVSQLDANTLASLQLTTETLLSSLPQPRSQANLVSDWALVGGNAARNGVLETDMPMRSVAWEVSNVIGDASGEKALFDLAKTKRGTGELPTFQPLLVGDWVLFRSTSKLIGGSMRRELGRTLEYPTLEDIDESLSLAAREAQMKQRVWENSLYGQVSSDGELVFLISEIPDMRGRSADVSNELVALELASEGKLKWIVGKDDDQDEPALMGMFFLGAPLPLGDSLFCIGERNGEIRVLELDKSTGKLLWSQQLSHVETRIRRADPRRFVGLNLAYADGILVCPTATGGVIGIDLTERRFAWGFEYERRFNQLARYTRVTDAGAWRGNGIVIQDGRVVLTPWDSAEMYCLDLTSGESVWKQKVARGDSLFVAGIHQDRVIVVGKSEVVALGVDDGKPMWKRKLRGAPSGRGIRTSDHYLLATTVPELVKIDLNSGAIVDRLPTEEPLGNLIASEDMIIAQNSLTLRTFFQKDKLIQKVERRLAENPNDPWALEHSAYVLLDQGKQQEGLEKLQQAITHYPTLQTPGLDYLARDRLADETFSMLLQDGGAQVLALADDARDLLPQGRLPEYLRVMTVRNLKEGRIMEAFESNLDLFMKSLAEAERLVIEPPMMEFGDRQIRPSRWHRAMFAAAWNAADDPQKRAMEDRMLARLESIDDSQQEAMIEVGQDLPFLHMRYLDLLARKLDTTSRIPYVEGPLLRLSQSQDVAVAARATVELARLYVMAGQMLAAADQYYRLTSQHSDVTVEDGRRGQEVAAAAIRANGSLKAYFDYQQARNSATEQAWGFGVVEATSQPQERQATRNLYGYSRSNSSLDGFMPLDSEHGRMWNDGLHWIVSQTQGERLELRDAMGQTVTELGTMFANSRRGREPKIRTFGHLVVGALENSVVALNGLRDTSASASAELWRDVRATSVTGPTSPVRKFQFGDLGIERQVEFGPNGRSPLSLGCVSDRGVVFRRSGDLVCVDPATGDVLWQRDDLRVEAEVWGDDEYVFAHVDQRYPRGGGNARVFSVLDGTELESRPCPNQTNRVRSYGRHVLTWKRDLGHEFDLRQDGSEPRARGAAGRQAMAVRNLFELRDLFSRKERWVWSKSYSQHARAAWLSYDELAIYDPEVGTLEIISVFDGSSRVEAKLETELAEVDTLFVTQQAGLYVVSLGQDTDGTVEGEVRYKSPVAVKPLQNIEVHAFAPSGEMVWGVPAKLVNFHQLPTQVDGIPLLVFARKNETDASRSKRLFETVALDVRDGHLAFQNSELYDASSRFRLAGRIGEDQVELLLPAQNGKWTLTFTDTPRAPAPPYGYATSQDRKRKRRTWLGSILENIPGTEIPTPESP